MDWTAASYLTYLAVMVPLTIWFAGNAPEERRVFLEDAPPTTPPLADAINKRLSSASTSHVGSVLLYLRTGGLVGDLSEPDRGGQPEGRCRDGGAG